MTLKVEHRYTTAPVFFGLQTRSGSRMIDLIRLVTLLETLATKRFQIFLVTRWEDMVTGWENMVTGWEKFVTQKTPKPLFNNGYSFVTIVDIYGSSCLALKMQNPYPINVSGAFSNFC